MLRMHCVQSVSYSVLVNGIPHTSFTPSKDLRQGDPLSPFLFLVCAKGLLGLLNHGMSSQTFSGLKINRHCPMISHLFFAANSILFFKATSSDCKTIRDILDLYSRASEQTIKNILGVSIGCSLGNYLSFPSQNNINKNIMFNQLKFRVSKK